MSVRLFIVMCALAIAIPETAYAGKLTDAVAKLAEKEWRSEIEDMDSGDIQDMAEVVEDVADDIGYDDDPKWREHILDTWGEGESDTRRHVSKCPYCRGAAVKVAEQTGLPDPPNRIPKCFVINGAPYGAGNWGELYPLHPQTGQVVGPAEGSIWFQNGRYLGVNMVGRAFSARPCS